MWPTLIHFGGFRLASYGVLVAAGFLAGIWYLARERERLGFDEALFQRFVTGIFLAGMGGGKLLYLLLYWRQMDWSPAGLVGDLRFGFVYFGGFIGAFLFGAWFLRRRRLPFWRIADAAAPALALGHGIGRLGCFAAGCCYGLPTALPWGIAFHHPDALVPFHLLGVPLHPAPLYEAAGDFALAAVLHVLVRPAVRAGRAPEGTSFLGYVVGYALLRFLVECVRGDDRGFYALGFSVSQWVSLGLIVAGVVALARRRHAA